MELTQVLNLHCKKSLDTFLFSLSSNVNLDVQQFVNLFISLFSEKSLFCVMLDGPHSHPLDRFLKKKYSKYCNCFLSSRLFLQGAESPSTSKQQGDAQTRDSVHEQLPQCQQGQNIESGRG